MSRAAAYLGPSIRVASVVEGGTTALTDGPRTELNGFGIGWYPEDRDPDPLRLIDRAPIWSSPHQMSIARRVTTRCAVACLGPSDGRATELSACQPFVHDRYLFCHVGELESFRGSLERPLREQLSPEAHGRLRGSSADELLFATWLDALGARAGVDAVADALEQMVTTVLRLAVSATTGAALAAIVSDGTCLASVRTSTPGVTAPSLQTIVASEDGPFSVTGRVVSTQPLFEGQWQEMNPHSLTVFVSE